MSEAKIAGSVKIPEEVAGSLARQKRAHRINNEKYFRVHPELRTMMSAFISGLLRDKPDNVHVYAEEFFTDPGLANSLGLTGWSRPETPVHDNLDAGGLAVIGDGVEFGGGGDAYYYHEKCLELGFAGYPNVAPGQTDVSMIDRDWHSQDCGNFCMGCQMRRLCWYDGTYNQDLGTCCFCCC